jgi:hypothetical protein
VVRQKLHPEEKHDHSSPAKNESPNPVSTTLGPAIMPLRDDDFRAMMHDFVDTYRLKVATTVDYMHDVLAVEE